MADPGPLRVSAASSGTSPWEFVSTFGAAILAIVVLFAFDLTLAKIDRSESASHAADLYAEGRGLLAGGDARGAVDRFASAFAIERENRDYALALGEALLADGRVREAETTLDALLSRAETDGAANLAMARVLVRANRVEEAKSYYHRAIYGRWRGDAPHQRLRARLELIDLLARRHENRELLAELLPLQDIAADSLALRRRLGHLFIAAGSPARGASIFRDLLRRDRSDADAYAGLGEAALAAGNFRTARADLHQAHRLDPGNPHVAALLAVADTIVTLDPEQRGLGAAERLARARAVLARTIAVLQRCLPAGPAESGRLLDAQRLLARVTPAAEQDRATDAILTSASELWTARPERCATDATVGGDALAHIQTNLGR